MLYGNECHSYCCVLLTTPQRDTRIIFNVRLWVYALMNSQSTRTRHPCNDLFSHHCSVLYYILQYGYSYNISFSYIIYLFMTSTTMIFLCYHITASFPALPYTTILIFRCTVPCSRYVPCVTRIIILCVVLYHTLSLT